MDESVNERFWMTQAVWPRGRRKLSAACCATVVQHHLPKLTDTKLQPASLWEASLLFWPDYLSPLESVAHYMILAIVTGGYHCQQGLVFQKDSHHVTPWKRVLQPYALKALTASRLWKQVLHQKRKDNKKHRSTSCHIRRMWPTLIIWISHTKVWSAFSWQ